MSPHDTHEVEISIERTEWVRALARSLVADEHEADDLAQEAWLARLTSGPTAVAMTRKWFASVLRNLARARLRGMKRREARERDVARRESIPAGEHLVERLEVHELLVRAVRELPEPYRTAIFLRYFEGLSPGAIAAREGVPLRTVDTRLHRALEKLRAKLDERHGGRGAWLALFVPLVSSRDATLAGVVAVNLKLKLVLAAAAVVALVWLTREALPESSRARAADEPAQLALSAPESQAPIAPISQRDAAESNEARAASAPARLTVPPPAPSDTVSAGRIRGLVVDANDTTVGGVTVFLRDDQSKEPLARRTTVSDTRGAFELDLPVTGCEIDVDSARWMVVLRPAVLRRDGALYVVVLAPRRQLAGVVVDEADAPLADAQVELLPPPKLRDRIQRVLDLCVDEKWRVPGGEGGAFALDPAPDLEGCSLRASATGYATSAVAIEPGDHFDLRVPLKRFGADQRRLRGRVVDEKEQPVSDARVVLTTDPPDAHLPLDSVVTDSRGEFDLELSDSLGGARVLRAIKEGFLPAEVACAAETPWAPGAWPDPLVLVLRASALSIQGVVLDEDGHAVSAADIVNLDTTRFGNVTREVEGLQRSFPEDTEALLAGRWTWFGSAAQCDDQGRFEVRGLLPKSYRLRVFSRLTMQVFVSDPIQAGRHDVVLRFAREPRRERIAGQVVGLSGAPIARAQVWLLREGEAPTSNSVQAYDKELSGNPIYADEQGRFEFRDVPMGVTAVRAQSDVQTPKETVVLANVPDPTDLRIAVARDCHFKLDLGETGLRANSLQAFDAHGDRMAVGIHRGSLWITYYEMPLEGESTEAMSVSEQASELVLNLEGGATKRIPLRLVPGELTIVRP